MINEDKGFEKSDEIDLIELAKVIWTKRLFIFKVTGVFILFGLIIAYTSPKEYKTSCILIPEVIEGGGGLGGSLGGLAALAGVDLGGISGAGSTINPGLYRSVARSTPFLLQLMNEEFYFEEIGKTVSLYEYYLYYRRTSLVSKIISIPFYIVELLNLEKNSINAIIEIDDIISLTKYQEGVAEHLKERILVTMDWDLNLVTIEVELQDPKVAAKVVAFTQSYITRYVESYAVSKGREQLMFVEKQFQEKKREFEQIQMDLASFRDKNQFVNTASAKSEEERLRSRYNLSFNIFNQLAQQVETIKLQINEDKPVFSVLEPVKVPTEKNKPKRTLIILIFFITGLTLGSLLIGIIYLRREK